jgi:hypothetical protein
MATALKLVKKKSKSRLTELPSREFRKTNEAIGLQVKEGSLSFLSRKIFNVMIIHAQDEKTPGANAPIQTATSSKYFWIPLHKVAKDAAFGSKDTEFLKDTIDHMQSIRLLFDNEKQWTSERLISSATLVNPAGLGSQSGEVWLGYSFPPEVYQHVLEPGTYTRLSLSYQNALRSGPALALYEICRRYASNPSKVTSIHDVPYWYGVLTGNPPPKAPIVYKYFKRDYLRLAISEVSALTNLTVELIEHKNGRRVERLQFAVDYKEPEMVSSSGSPIIDTALVEKVMTSGLSNKDATEVVAQYDHEMIQLALVRLETRMKPAAGKALDNPAGYFRWLLDDLAKNPPDVPPAAPVKSVVPVKNKAQSKSLMEKFLAARAQDALDVYLKSTEPEQVKIMESFKADPASKMVNFEKGMANMLFKTTFSQWHAQYLWGAPSLDALTRFMDMNSADD